LSKRIVVGLLIALAGDANAQLWPSTSSPDTSTITITNEPPIATVSQDGEVMIDWQRVEAVASDPNYWNKELLGYARLMIAIRDGTYKKAPH
jgi:hypothetical protein